MDNNIITIDLTHLLCDDWMSHISPFLPTVIDRETEDKIRSKFWFYESVERIKYPSLRDSIMNSLDYRLYECIKENDEKKK